MATKLAVDFHVVDAKHAEIHARLENWAKWCRGSWVPSISPMFLMYRSPARARGAEHTWSASKVDSLDAARVARFIGQLPEQHRRVLNWCYVRPVNPRRAAQEIGVTIDDLMTLLHNARQMLLNRKA